MLDPEAVSIEPGDERGDMGRDPHLDAALRHRPLSGAVIQAAAAQHEQATISPVDSRALLSGPSRGQVDGGSQDDTGPQAHPLARGSGDGLDSYGRYIPDGVSQEARLVDRVQSIADALTTNRYGANVALPLSLLAAGALAGGLLVGSAGGSGSGDGLNAAGNADQAAIATAFVGAKPAAGEFVTQTIAEPTGVPSNQEAAAKKTKDGLVAQALQLGGEAVGGATPGAKDQAIEDTAAVALTYGTNVPYDVQAAYVDAEVYENAGANSVPPNVTYDVTRLWQGLEAKDIEALDRAPKVVVPEGLQDS